MIGDWRLLIFDLKVLNPDSCGIAIKKYEISFLLQTGSSLVPRSVEMTASYLLNHSESIIKLDSLSTVLLQEYSLMYITVCF